MSDSVIRANLTVLSVFVGLLFADVVGIIRQEEAYVG